VPYLQVGTLQVLLFCPACMLTKCWPCIRCIQAACRQGIALLSRADTSTHRRLPEVCAQLGLPADQITSDKAPHLLLCAALLAAPSAISWAWHKAATAVMTNMASRTASARRSAAAVLTGNGSGPVGNKEDGDAQQQQHGDGSLLRMSYSTLPLVWAGTST
jgi:hypothetical protein